MVSGAGAIAGGLAPLVSTAASAVRGGAGPWAFIGALPAGAFTAVPVGEAGRRKVRIPATAATATITARTGRKPRALDRDRRGGGGSVAGPLIDISSRARRRSAPDSRFRPRRVNNALLLSAPKSRALADHAGPTSRAPPHCGGEDSGGVAGIDGWVAAAGG
jgi:hypothetical protein